MSSIDDLIAEECPGGVEFRALGEVGQFVRGTAFRRRTSSMKDFACIHYGADLHGLRHVDSNDESFVAPELAARLKQAATGDLVIVATSENVEDVCKAVAWLGDEEIAISDDCVIYRHDLDPMYVAYFFQTEAFRDQKRRFVTGTKVKRYHGAEPGRIKIPVPPLAVQREIVAILDRLERLKAELEAELEAELDTLPPVCVLSATRSSIGAERTRFRWSLGDVAGGLTAAKRILPTGNPARFRGSRRWT